MSEDFDPTDWYTPAENFPEFSRQDIDVFIQAFKEFDVDKSGAIDGNELQEALKSMGQGATPEDVQKLIKMVDDDGTKQLEWPKYLKIMRHLYPDRRAQFVKKYMTPAKKFPHFTERDINTFVQTFQEFDLDQSGAIDAYELEKAFQLMGQGVTPEEIDDMIKNFDNGHNEIDFEGFLRLMSSLYPERKRRFMKKFYGPARDFMEFSKTDIDVFIQAFHDYDADGSGTIDAVELKNALTGMGQGISEEDCKLVVMLADETGAGAVTWEGFLKIMRFCYPEKRIKFIKEFYGTARDFPEFSSVDIDTFIHAFKDFDADGSGAIDQTELYVALWAMGQPADPEGVKKLIAEVDFDKTGEIEWKKFLMIMRKFYPEKLKEYEEKWFLPAKKFSQFSREDIEVFIQGFRNYDLDDSGSMSTDELTIAFWMMGQGVAPNEVAEIVKKYDADASGEIDWPEFLQIMADLYDGKALIPEAKPAQASAPTTSVKASPPSPSVTPKTAAAPAPASSNPPAKWSGTAPSTGSLRGSGSSNPKCELCGKTVYPIEMLAMGNRSWHKGCFKCEEPGCGLTLNLKTATVVEMKLFCQKHVPKAKPISTTLEGNLVHASQASAPKLNKAQGIKKDSRMSFHPNSGENQTKQ